MEIWHGYSNGITALVAPNGWISCAWCVAQRKECASQWSFGRKVLLIPSSGLPGTEGRPELGAGQICFSFGPPLCSQGTKASFCPPPRFCGIHLWQEAFASLMSCWSTWLSNQYNQTTTAPTFNLYHTKAISFPSHIKSISPWPNPEARRIWWLMQPGLGLKLEMMILQAWVCIFIELECGLIHVE
jgi:hypothetical protein